MSEKLDELLKGAPVDRASLEKARGLLAAELKKPRPRGWRADAVLLLATSWGLAGLVATALLVLGASSAALLARHGASFALVLVVGAVCAWAALAPPPRSRPWVGAMAAGLGVVGLVALRAFGLTAPGSQPEWVCTVTHLATGAVPLAVALSMLRKSAPNPLRAVLAGIAVGTCGALIGEVGCTQPWQHVLVFHASAWLIVAAACAVVSRRLVRSSYAP